MSGGLIDRLNIIIDYNVDDRRPNVLVGIGSKSVPPEILCACRESYTVVSSRYTKSFGCLDGVAQTWFSFDRDILYIRASCFEFSASSNLFEIAAQLFSTHPMLDLENVRRVKFLAIGLGIYFNDADMMQDGYFEPMLAFFMFIFRGVEKIYCVMTHRSDETPCEEIKPEFMVDPIDIDETAGLYAITPESNQLREVPEAILLECPPIDREIMKEWWEALMPGRGPCPSPDIEFRAIFEPDTQGYLEYFKEGCRRRIQEFVKNNKVV